MKQFKDFKIQPTLKHFIGDKIKIDRILNKQVVIHAFEISASKIEGKGNGKCLKLQLEVDGQKRILFSGSVTLQNMIEQVPEKDFPFTTTIIKETERLEFS